TGRHWKILNVHYYVGKKVIFFLGSQQTTQPLVFILPVSSDDAYSTDELFNLTKNLKEYVTHQHVQSVLLAIISNDFTISYYKLTNGLFSDNHLSMPSQTQMEIQLRSSTSEKRSLSNVDDEPIVEQIKFPRINEDKEEELILQLYQPDELEVICQEILDMFDKPENITQLREARLCSANDAVIYMNCIFPKLARLQSTVLEKHGFNKNDGNVLFTLLVKQNLSKSTKLHGLYSEIRGYFIPPI
ncbi:unnamed protein product, partial [Didymodactylos carnosus]